MRCAKSDPAAIFSAAHTPRQISRPHFISPPSPTTHRMSSGRPRGSLSAEQRANAVWKKMLAEYQDPGIDPASRRSHARVYRRAQSGADGRGGGRLGGTTRGAFDERNGTTAALEEAYDGLPRGSISRARPRPSLVPCQTVPRPGISRRRHRQGYGCRRRGIARSCSAPGPPRGAHGRDAARHGTSRDERLRWSQRAHTCRSGRSKYTVPRRAAYLAASRARGSGSRVRHDWRARGRLAGGHEARMTGNG